MKTDFTDSHQQNPDSSEVRPELKSFCECLQTEEKGRCRHFVCVAAVHGYSGSESMDSTVVSPDSLKKALKALYLILI